MMPIFAQPDHIKKQLRGPSSGQRVLQNEDHRVASEEHLGDEPVLVDRLGLLLALWIKDESTFKAISSSPTFASLGQLSPHLLHALQHHVAVSVESFHSPQKLLVVPVDSFASVVGVLKQGRRTCS